MLSSLTVKTYKLRVFTEIFQVSVTCLSPRALWEKESLEHCEIASSGNEWPHAPSDDLKDAYLIIVGAGRYVRIVITEERGGRACNWPRENHRHGCTGEPDYAPMMVGARRTAGCNTRGRQCLAESWKILRCHGFVWIE